MTTTRYVAPPKSTGGRWQVWSEDPERRIDHALGRVDAVELAVHLTARDSGGEIRVLDEDGELTQRIEINAGQPGAIDRYIEPTANGWGLRVGADSDVIDLGGTQAEAVQLAHLLAGPGASEIRGADAEGNMTRRVRTT